MMPVKPTAPRSRVKHSTTEPLRSQDIKFNSKVNGGNLVANLNGPGSNGLKDIIITRFGSQLFSKRHISKERDNSEKDIIWDSM